MELFFLSIGYLLLGYCIGVYVGYNVGLEKGKDKEEK